ncbi:MAG TPA: YdiU family protein [Gemmatimonadales bacterium]
MRPLAGLGFENSYARLHPDFYQVVEPTPLPDPRLVAFNPDAAALIDLDPAQSGHPDAARYLSGSLPLPGAAPIAQAYAGHQFGVWVPQLGDGRAFLLGEVQNSRGESWDLHLKGGGQTRWSRFGDGRSVLRSTVREYLACEALHALDIPTTRALSIVASDLPVQRESLETAAAIIRLAPSHVRFGTFEYFAARGAAERVRELADYVMARHFRDLPLRTAQGDNRRYSEFFGEVCRRTARLIARWMAAGFAHGVMNTDNMSILGITLDYGPYGFLDDYDAGFICNHTDTGGQYAFDRQPSVGIWNCARLGEALMTLEGGAEATAPWQEALESYWPAFVSEYAGRMRARLGLATAREEDAELLRDLLALLQGGRVDYTRFFRALNSVNGQRSTVNGTLSAMFMDRAGSEAWFDRYRARLRAEQSDDAERSERMSRVNPKYLLRNWVAQEAIAAAQRGEFGLVDALRRLLAAPCDEHPGWERYAEPPTPAAREIEVSCSS